MVSLRYADVIGTLQLLIDIYRDEPNDDIRRQILNAVKNLSEYNIEAYKRRGPMLQMALVDHIAGMSDTEVDSIRPIALTVWTETIQSDITGAKWKADSVVLSTGAVPASDQLREVRDKAIKALFAAYDRPTMRRSAQFFQPWMPQHGLALRCSLPISSWLPRSRTPHALSTS